MNWALIRFVDFAFSLYGYILLAYIILSWFPIDRSHPALRLIARLSEPVLRPARQIIPSFGGIDFSPILVFFLLQIVRNFVIRLLAGILL